MADLVAFLEARLRAEEALVRGAMEFNGADWGCPITGVVQFGPPDHELATFADRDLAEHIAAWDPARVLAEITAKRDHLKMWTEAQERRDKALKLAASDSELARKASVSARAEANGYCEAVMRLVSQDAAIYADHPDYDPAWR